MAAQQVFVDYDALVGDGGATAASLSHRLGLTVALDAGQFRAAAPHHGWPSPRLLREAEAVYAELRARAGTGAGPAIRETRLEQAMAG